MVFGGAVTDTSTNSFYLNERDNNVYSGNNTSWIGKIALLYVSDYGYSTSGNSNVSRSTCLEKDLSFWNSDELEECRNNSYLYSGKYVEYFLTSDLKTSYQFFVVGISGWVVRNANDNGSRYIKPTLFLKSDISIGVGDGTEANPYQLNI